MTRGFFGPGLGTSTLLEVCGDDLASLPGRRREQDGVAAEADRALSPSTDEGALKADPITDLTNAYSLTRKQLSQKAIKRCLCRGAEVSNLAGFKLSRPPGL